MKQPVEKDTEVLHIRVWSGWKALTPPAIKRMLHSGQVNRLSHVVPLNRSRGDCLDFENTPGFKKEARPVPAEDPFYEA
jgi:hypothetical protein